MSDLTFGTITSLALGSSVVGSLITQGATWLREGRSTKRETAYLALRIATAFERFAEEATGFIDQMATYKRGSAEGVSTDLPELPALPDEKERWRDLNVLLTARILGFDEYRRSRQGSINDTWENTSPDDAIEAAKAYAIILAKKALHLSMDVRKRYDLPSFNTASVWPEFLSNEFEALPTGWQDELSPEEK